jgi:bifunctional DNase/RNase
MIEVTVAQLGLDRATNSPVVILREKDGSRVLPIWIGPAEASAIAMEMQGIKPPRPMTHDLLKTVIAGLGASMQRVNISAIKEKTYFAELWLARDDHLFQLDARPSDSIALALRMNAPIFTEADLLEHHDEDSIPSTPDPSAEAEKLRAWLEKMDPEDFGKFQP